MPIETAADLLRHCRENGLTIPEVVLRNERAWRSDEAIRAGLLRIWDAMRECIYRGCHTEGTLPGGLNVVRRAAGMNRRAAGRAGLPGRRIPGWTRSAGSAHGFRETLKWVSASPWR